MCFWLFRFVCGRSCNVEDGGGYFEGVERDSHHAAWFGEVEEGNGMSVSEIFCLTGVDGSAGFSSSPQKLNEASPLSREIFGNRDDSIFPNSLFEFCNGSRGCGVIGYSPGM